MDPAPPGWMRIPLSIDAFRRSEYKDALREAEYIIQTGDERGIILALAASLKLKNLEDVMRYETAYKASKTYNPSDPMGEVRAVFNSPNVIKLYQETLEGISAI